MPNITIPSGNASTTGTTPPENTTSNIELTPGSGTRDQLTSPNRPFDWYAFQLETHGPPRSPWPTFVTNERDAALFEMTMLERAGLRTQDFAEHGYPNGRPTPISTMALCVTAPLIVGTVGLAVGSILGAACKGAKDLAQDNFELDSFIEAVWKTGAVFSGFGAFIGCSYACDRPTAAQREAIIHELNYLRPLVHQAMDNPENPPENFDLNKAKCRLMYLEKYMETKWFRMPQPQENWYDNPPDL